MSRKNKRKRQNLSSGGSHAPTTNTADDTSTSSGESAKSTPPRISVNAMDLFRAQDAASKQAIAMARVSDGFDNFVSKVGLNNDNALSAGTYDFNLITRNRILLEAAYRGSWIVGAVIDSVAEDMTRAGVEIVTAEKVDLSILEKAMTRLQLWQSLATDIKWGRLYGGAIGIMQIDGQDLATPLDIESVGKDQFLGIAVYDRWMLNPILSPVITSGPNLGLPAVYQIVSSALQNLGNPGPDDLAKQGIKRGKPWDFSGIINVHHSRCVRYTGIDLPFFQAITEQMWGESILERIWDRLIAFDNATMSSASLIDRANLRTIGIDGLREIIAAGGEAQAGLTKMFDMMRLLQVNEGLTLIDKEDTFVTTAYSFAGLSDMMLQFGQQLAGATGIPLVRLFSQSPAGLNSTGDADIRMYYDNINAQQEAKLREPFDTVLKVMWRSVYGTSSPEDLEFSFTPLWQMDATDKANNAKTTTETVIAAFDAGLVPQKAAMMELKDSSGNTGIFSNITEEDIDAADEELPPTPDEQALTLAETAGKNDENGDEKKPNPVKDAKGWFRWLKKQ